MSEKPTKEKFSMKNLIKTWAIGLSVGMGVPALINFVFFDFPSFPTLFAYGEHVLDYNLPQFIWWVGGYGILVSTGMGLIYGLIFFPKLIIKFNKWASS